MPARGVSAIDKIVAAARKHGKWVGRLVNDGPGARKAKADFDSVAITGDTKALQNWYTAQIETARA